MNIKPKKDLKKLLKDIDIKISEKIKQSKKITLCMIVKDEEKNIERCLNSVKGIVDEIIIVDTGSIDNTVELCKKYDAKIFYYQWNNDFAAARNYSLDQATGDWILVLDADEELSDSSKLVLKEFLINETKYNCYRVSIKNLDESGNVSFENKMVRLLKNNEGIKYYGKIHEYVIAEASELSQQLYIFHHGYKERNLTNNKIKNRNISMFKSILEDKESTDLEKLNSELYLGQSYYALNEIKIAESYLISHINNTFLLKDTYKLQVPAIAYFLLMEMYIDTHEFYKIDKLLKESSERYNSQLHEYGDYWYFKALIERSEFNYKTALELFIKALECFLAKNNQYQGFLIDNTRYNLSLYYLCDLCIKLYDYNNLYKYVEKIFKNVSNPEIRRLTFTLIRDLDISKNKKLNNIKKNMSLEFPLEAKKFNNSKLSLCMIVKNEEKNIERCLNSVKGIVDEIIIVDTGSTDNTVDLCKKYNAKIFYYQWNNDFAAARNYSLDQATGDWVLVLDADEELCPNITKNKIKSFMINSDIDICFNILIKNISQFSDSDYDIKNYMTRMFNKTTSNRYSGKVHEHIKNPTIYLSEEDIYIIHHGYKDLEFNEKKQNERNLPILKEIMDDQTQSIRDRITAKFYIALSKLDTDEQDIAEKYLLEILGQSNEEKFTPNLFAWLYLNLMHISYKKNDYLKVESLLKESENVLLIFDMSDFWFYKGFVEHSKANNKDAIKHYIKCTDLYNDSSKRASSALLYSIVNYFLALTNICSLAIVENDSNLLDNYLNLYLKEAENQPQYLVNLSNIYFRLEKYEEVLELNKKILQMIENKLGENVSDLKITVYNNLSKVYMVKNDFSNALKTQLVIHEYSHVRNQFFKLAEILQKEGNFLKAEEIYSTIINNVENDFQAHLYRANLFFIQNKLNDNLNDLEQAYKLASNEEEKLKVLNFYINFNYLDKALVFILNNHSNNYQFNLLLAKIYKLKNQFIEAEKILKDNLLKYSDKIETYYELGSLYLNNNQIDDSINILNRGLEIDNSNIDILYLISSIFIMRGEYSLSRKHINFALTIYPNNNKFIMLNEELEMFIN